MQNNVSKRKLIVRAAVRIVLFPAIFFIPAGTIYWPEAWIYMAVNVPFVFINITWLLKHNPDLLKERMKFPLQKEQKGWDKILVIFILLLYLIWIPLPGLDAVRYEWSHVPLFLKIIGFTGLFPPLFIISLVLRENTYLAQTVKIQQDKGHRVISSGPYKIVRHPMYSASFILAFAWPLALGSFYALLVTPAFIIIIIIRTYLEDKILQKELPGYLEYTKKVPFRLLPGVW